MKSGWCKVSFQDAVSDVSSGNVKTPQFDFMPEGRFAVVDQGKELIAGYLDDQRCLCNSKLPVIIFGDHTRCFKFIDFPFCIGADGVKVLRPKMEIDVKYLYYYLCHLQLVETGYNRHFKYLKQNDVVIPPFKEQLRIAEILDKAEELRTKRRAALALLDTLTQSIFIDMFGDPNEIQVRWNNVKLEDILDFLTSGSRGWAKYYSDSGDLFLRIQNVKHDELILNDVAFVLAPDTAEAKRTRVEPGDVLLSITADLGRTAVIPDNIGNAFINQHLSILRTKVTEPRYLSAYLSSPAGQKQVHRSDKHAVKAGLNFDDIRSFVIPFPPLNLQQDFAKRVAAVDKLKASHKTSLAKLDELFASLQYRAFRGEL